VGYALGRLAFVVAVMIEILKSFEQVAGRFNPLVLVVPGVLMAALGLFVWLGGLGFRRAVFAVIGTLAGGLAGVLLANGNGAIAAAAAVTAALIAAVFQRLSTAVLLGLIALAVTFVLLAYPGFAEYKATSIAGQDLGRGDQTLSVQDSLNVASTYGLDLLDGLRHAAGALHPVRWVILAIVAVGLATFGALFRSIGAAVVCAVLGTALIFAGLLSLVIFKGSAPVTRIANGPGFYGLVFAGMAAFGTLEQLALCRRTEKNKSKSKSRRQESDEGKSKRSWRNR
jgi:hypothetical protein